MKVLYSWLNDFVDLSDVSPIEVADALTKVGMEVEEIIDMAKGLDKVIVAKILKIEKHPNADKLVVCQVDIGGGKTVQIVTGAKNMKEGDTVPLALNGANLPNGQTILSGEIRGEKSEGMFCGGDEIGVTEDMYKGAGEYGLLILKNGEKIGLPIAEALGLNDVIFDVNVLPNRPDANSTMVIALEIAAALNKKFKAPNLSYKAVKGESPISVEVKNFNECLRYMGCYVKNVKNTESPAWLKRRLTLVGHTPYSLFVDITNYVLHEVGQPMHVFDSDRIYGGKIVVRNADNEMLKTLDGKDRLIKNELCICDKNKPLVIAGIMGGVESGTYTTTQNVFLESAVFDYATIRRNSRKIGLTSDSSLRNSKGVYFDSAEVGLKRALSLISELGVGEIVDDIKDVYKIKPQNKTIEVSVERINKILALNVSGEQCEKILNNLQFKTTLKGNKLITTAPSFRTDVERDCDIIEEIGRSVGFDNVKVEDTSYNKTNFKGGLTAEQVNINKIKNMLVNLGTNEIISYQFSGPEIIENARMSSAKNIKLLNPLGQEYSLLREKLLPNDLNILSKNYKLGNKSLSLFEIARTFETLSLPLKELPNEKTHLCIMQVGGEYSYFSLKHLLDLVGEAFRVNFDYRRTTLNKTFHTGRAAEVCLYNRPIGVIGELHPIVLENIEVGERVYALEIDLTELLKRNIVYKQSGNISKLQTLNRDLALVVNKNVEAAKIINCIKACDKVYIEDAIIFDIYEGEQVESGKKSVAVKFYIKQTDKNLTDTEINEIMNKVIGNCNKFLGAELR